MARDPVLISARIIAVGMAVSVFLFPLVVASSKTGLAGAALPKPLFILGVMAGFALLVFAGKAEALLIRYFEKRKFTGPTGAFWLLAIIVAMSMREACAIIGLQLSLLTGNLFFCVLLGVPAFVSILANFPTAQSLERETERHGGGNFNRT